MAFELDTAVIKAAAARIAPHVVRTPLVRAQAVEGVWLKLETQQPTGSFKVRPAINSMLTHLDACRERGVVASSSGNFAQAVAWGARRLGLRASIVMPSNTQPYKIERTRLFGGVVHLSGPSFEERWALTQRLEADTGGVLVHPYDTPETIAGDATAGLELLEQLDSDFTVVVPCSGGGLLAGIATAVKAARPHARVIGVQSAANGSMARSFAAGQRMKSPPFTTIADALVASIPGETTFEIIKRLVDDVVVVDEDELRAAVRWLATEQKLVVEPGGAASLAAVQAGKIPSRGDVVCIASGGNIEPKMLGDILCSGKK